MLGMDAAGTVKRVGSKVQRLRNGDRVAFAKPGGMCTNVRVQGDLPQLLPDSLSFEDGATIPLTFMAAYRSLVEVANLEKGERVLIHAAAGGMFELHPCPASYSCIVLNTMLIEKKDLVKQ